MVQMLRNKNIKAAWFSEWLCYN